MPHHKVNNLDYLTFHDLDQHPRLRHAVSLHPPDSPIDFSSTDPIRQTRSIEHLCTALQIAPTNLARIRQVHGAAIRVIDSPDQLKEPTPDADAICTNVPGLGGIILGADCPLVILYDPTAHALGLAHAGWRSTVAGILTQLVAELTTHFAADPMRLHAAIAPCICKDCFEVGPEVREQALQNPTIPETCFRPTPRPDDPPAHPHYRFDLIAANRAQLRHAGLSFQNIETAPYCTVESPHLFPSYRRDGKIAGRFALIAALT